MASTGKSEALMRDYEFVASEIEALGDELISAAKQCEVMTADVHKAIRDTAEAYRQEGKKISIRIEECALFTAEVRKTCDDAKRRIIEGDDGGIDPRSERSSFPIGSPAAAQRRALP